MFGKHRKFNYFLNMYAKILNETYNEMEELLIELLMNYRYKICELTSIVISNVIHIYLALIQ